jgi:hypothetical protein
MCLFIVSACQAFFVLKLDLSVLREVLFECNQFKLHASFPISIYWMPLVHDINIILIMCVCNQVLCAFSEW